MDELEQVDRLREVAQVVDAQVAEARPVRQVVTSTRDRRRGYEHLAAVAGAHDAGGTVDVDAHVVGRSQRDGPGVDAHPHPDHAVGRPGGPGEPSLRLEGGVDRRRRSLEDDEERVALGVHDLPAAALDDVAQELVVELEDAAVGVAQPIEEAGRALDIGEQQRDDTGRQPCARGCGGRRAEGGGRGRVDRSRAEPSCHACALRGR